MPGRVDARVLIGLALLMAASLACNAQLAPSGSTPTALEPFVVFIAPQNNSVIAEGSEITLAVNISDPTGTVGKIEFRIDDTLIGTQNAPSDAPQSGVTVRQTWKATGAQGHLVVVDASHADGTPLGEAKITLQVTSVASATATLTPTQPATISPTAQPVSASATVAPSNTVAVSPAQASATPTQPTLLVTSPNLNIRAGPGTNFPIIGAMKTGDTAIIIGRNGDRSWWYILKEPARGWVISQTAYGQVSGDTANVPLVASPPTPVPSAAPPTNPPAAAATSTTGPVADLVIDGVTLNPGSPQSNQTFTASVVIRNQGTVNAGTSLMVGVFQPGNETSPVAVPAISAGQSITVNMPVTLHSGGANQSAVLTLDSNNEINEGPNGEANNVKTINYNVN